MRFLKNKTTLCSIGAMALAGGTAAGCGYCAVILAGGAAFVILRHLARTAQTSAIPTAPSLCQAA